jgi:hypothetical protein
VKYKLLVLSLGIVLSTAFGAIATPAQSVAMQGPKARAEILLPGMEPNMLTRVLPMTRFCSGMERRAGSTLGDRRSTWQWGELATVKFERTLAPLADESQRALMTVEPPPNSW